MALLLQRLCRAQQSSQQLLHLQGSFVLSGFRDFSAAAPEKTKNRGLGSSRAEGTAPRFYKYVGVEPAAGQVRGSCRSQQAYEDPAQLQLGSTLGLHMQAQGWQITLNDRALKTPARQPLIVPSYPLALAIAAEWEWQVSCCCTRVS